MEQNINNCKNFNTETDCIKKDCFCEKKELTISEEAKLRAKNYMRLKDGYVEPNQERERGIVITHVGKKETLEQVKDLAYWRANAEEDYMKVPISVLRYISELEKSNTDFFTNNEEMMSMLIEAISYKIPFELSLQIVKLLTKLNQK